MTILFLDIITKAVGVCVCLPVQCTHTHTHTHTHTCLFIKNDFADGKCASSKLHPEYSVNIR